MVTDSFYKKVLKIQTEHVTKDAPMADYTTFKIGGPADLLVEPESIDAFTRLLQLCHAEHVPLMVIGAGSNLLVSDKGIDGVVVKFGDAFDFVTTNGTEITCGSGTSLAKLAKHAQRAGLSGLEFASGIPGNVGGAIYMNAGAYGGEMKDVVMETTYIDEDGTIQTVKGDAHEFSYRHSLFCQGKKYIISAKMKLILKNPEEILKNMQELNAKRKEKQPLEKPSAGSTFKRPEGHFAGKLIEDAGLKGASFGGASISEKHAGFVVNNGGATCSDVVSLIQHVQAVVLEKFGVTLEPEIRVIGR
ncbi:MAG: UDP-N-acetylmuramate dehydrogenase [Clostridia bacterium]|nr:UDP-N-acetylmuramate dehydrogenase [Clostridia bacterium]